MTDQKVTRSLGAVLAIDAVGYSRQMARDEEATLQRLQAYRAAIAGLVARHGGRVFGIAGDSEIAFLPGALEALACALDIERAIEALNADLPAGRRMPLRFGIHFGKVLIEGDHVYGDDVNIAARVEGLAGKGGICLSGAAFDRVNGRLPLGFEAYGPQKFKNMDRPVRVYRLRDEPLMVGRVVPGRPPRVRSRWRLVAALAVLAVVGAGLWNLYLQERAAESQRLAAERAAVAQDHAQRLRAALDDAEARARGERGRAAELVTALRAAEQVAAARAGLVAAAERREAGRLAQEAARAETLIAALAQAEARAEAERQKAQDLLGALHAAEAQATAAQDRARREKTAARAAERQRAEALLASWQAAERQAVAERERVEALLTGLRGAEDQALAERARAEERAAARAQAERARAGERAQAEALLAALAAAERQAAAELERGEALLATLEAGEGVAEAGAGAPERARIEALLADLQAAGGTAAAERKRAELLLASWETPEAEAAAEDMDAAPQAAETRTAERARAEALLGLWQDAEATAATERARAEALLTALREADERAALERAVAPQRKPAPEARDRPEEAAPETEALTPAPVAPDQLAALPSQPEATDTALSRLGRGATAPTDDEASLEAVERLLRAREAELHERFQAYLDARPELFDHAMPRIQRIWDIDVVSRAGENYRVRIDFETTDPSRGSRLVTMGHEPDSMSLLLRWDGDDFEIVGHAVPADEFKAVERLLGEREEDLRNRLQAYFDAHPEEFDWSSPQVRRIWDIEALSRENETYEVRVILERPPAHADGYYKNAAAADALLVFMKLDGDDFEIVGHAFSSDERRGQAAATSTEDDLEDVERLLGERRVAFEAEVSTYLWNNWADQGNAWSNAKHFRILGFKVLAGRGDAYEVRVTVVKTVVRPQGGGGAEKFILSLRRDGDDFRIVGYRRL